MRLRVWIVGISVTLATGCVASFDVGAQAMRDTQGQVGAGFSAGGAAGVALPRGALLAATRYQLGANPDGETGMLLHSARLRWHDDPGPWSPRAGFGFGIHGPYGGDAAAAAFGTIGIARGLFRDCRSFIATSLELTLGHTWGSETPANNAVFGVLTLSMVLERWPDRRAAHPPPEAE